MPGILRAGIDNHVCTQLEGNVPHVGGPAGAPIPPAVTTVLINGMPIVTQGDAAFCVGRPDKVVAGIASVKAGGKFVADSSAATDHGGQFVTSSTNVKVG
jgi:uncharacterized Zn-binding protein involved in type VI secretion